MDSYNVNNTPASARTKGKAAEQGQLTALLAEYQALRAEMEWLISDGTKYQNLAMTLIGVALAAVGWVIKDAQCLLLPILLAIPFLFCMLGFLFFRQHEEVYVIAAYIREHIRPRLRALLGDDSMWEWEEFKASRTRKMSSRGFSKPFSSANIVWFLRTMIFIIPSILSLATASIYAYVNWFEHVMTIHGLFLIVYGSLFLFDFVILLMMVLYIFFHGDLQSRILALKNVSQHRGEEQTH
jgi:hypothetical protein